MLRSSNIIACDMFCGAGGFSYGLLKAAEEQGFKVRLTAIDRWKIAIETHSVNHPNAHHICADISDLDPLELFPGGRIDILLASPECTHHSRARGGIPRCEKNRESAWYILKWAKLLEIEEIIIENVREFKKWGPLNENGNPDKTREGDTFRRFIKDLKSMNYHIDWRVLNCADYGDPTSRKRLFIRASKKGNIVWPAKNFEGKWRTIEEIIDWSFPGTSILDRRRPLKKSTIKRILDGIIKFSKKDMFDVYKPFILHQCPSGRSRGMDNTMSTIMTRDIHALVNYSGELKVKPFIIKYFGMGGNQYIKETLDTIKTRNHFAFVIPVSDRKSVV